MNKWICEWLKKWKSKGVNEWSEWVSERADLLGGVLGGAERRGRAEVAEARAAREREAHEGQVQARESGRRARRRHRLGQPAVHIYTYIQCICILFIASINETKIPVRPKLSSHK